MTFTPEDAAEARGVARELVTARLLAMQHGEWSVLTALGCAIEHEHPTNSLVFLSLLVRELTELVAGTYAGLAPLLESDPEELWRRSAALIAAGELSDL